MTRTCGSKRVPSLVDLGDDPWWIPGGGTDSFGGGAGFGVGVSGKGVDELGILLMALNAAEESLGVGHAGGGPAQHHLPCASGRWPLSS